MMNWSLSKAFSHRNIFWETSFLKEHVGLAPDLIARVEGPFEDLQVFEPCTSQFFNMEIALKICNPLVAPDTLTFILRGSQVMRELYNPPLA